MLRLKSKISLFPNFQRLRILDKLQTTSDTSIYVVCTDRLKATDDSSLLVKGLFCKQAAKFILFELFFDLRKDQLYRLKVG